MRLTKLLLFLISISGVHTAYAENFYIFAGGGGEEGRSKNRFTAEFIASAKYLNQRSSPENYTVLFDGNHPKQKSLVQSEIEGASVKDFTSASLRATIDKYIAQVESGNIKKGDSIILSFGSHGSLEKEGHPHTLSTKNEEMDPKPEIKRLQRTLQDKGIQLAVIDDSCHSLPTLEVANDFTCVITTADENISYTNPGYFWGVVAPNSSLEDHFLSRRKSFTRSHSPQISTLAGKKTSEIMADLNEYLRGYSKDLIRHYNSVDATSCNPASPIERTNLRLNSVLNEMGLQPTTHSDLTDEKSKDYISQNGLEGILTPNKLKQLGELIREYDLVRKNAAEAHQSLRSPKYDIEVSGIVETNGESFEIKDTVRRLAEIDWIEFSRVDLKIYEDPTRSKSVRDEALFYAEAFTRKAELASHLKEKEGPFQEYHHLQLRRDAANEIIEKIALRIKDIERGVYDSIYKRLQGQREEPCSKIRL